MTEDSSFTNYATCSVQGHIHGTIFMREGASGTEFRVSLTGVSSGLHGFHVHQYGDLFTKDEEGLCMGAGGHYNPENQNHAGPDDAIRHIGDLGNVCADENEEVNEVFVDSKALLTGQYSILSRAIVVHSGEDDLISSPTGAAGSRLGCCVIGDAAEWVVDDVEPGHELVSSTSRVRVQLASIILSFCLVIFSKQF